MSQRGNPPDAAVVAAPIRRECEDTGEALDDGMAFFKRLFSRRRVSRELSVYVKSGPVFTFRWLMYVSRLRTGQIWAPDGDKHIVQPSLNGSVLEVLILI